MSATYAHPGLRRDVIEAVRTLPNNPQECVREATHRVFATLRRCRTYDEFKTTLCSAIAPTTHCVFCATKLSEQHRVPDLNFGQCMVFIEPEKRLIVPVLHRTHSGELTPMERSKIHLAHERVEARCGLTESKLLACLDDPEAPPCTVEHLHYRVVSAEEYYRRTTARDAWLTRDLEEGFARLLAFVSELTEDGGFGALFTDTGR